MYTLHSKDCVLFCSCCTALAIMTGKEVEDILDDETADKPPDFKMLNDEFYQVVIEGSTGQYTVVQ